MLLKLAMLFVVLAAIKADVAVELLGTSDKAVNVFLKEHNTLRAAVGVPDLTWNQTLSDYAASWGAKCQSDFSQGPYGENIISMYPNKILPEQIIVQNVVQMWSRSKSNVDFPKWTCAQAMCFEYSQIVWKNTTSFGCAITRCSVTSRSQFYYYTVCEFSPRGNIPGQVPY